jgi:hypothetical protein
MRPTVSIRKRPLLIADPGQRVRLRARRISWRGTFRAVSEPYTDETGEVVMRVAKEGEYQNAIREGRRAVSMPWPVRQIEVVSPLGDDSERTQELPQRSREEPERARPRPGGTGAQNASERVPWWRRWCGG